MPESVIVALIGLGGSLAGSFIGIIVSSRLTTYRLEQLEKKVQAHNSLVERMYGIEARVDLDEEKIRVANHRIDDLEKSSQAEKRH